ncbi:GNAT family N-acetyltransferase [Clostridioides sp. ZZV15-6388]|uniref:GNAT family N-acetyltransferase n=1 Tax=unclassified Clostridioides TaxID=2635829 RepID=UPI001D1199A7|nr:GNAT family N-acetyltransferase [Clostridioides sp. ZZV15-6388]MCC0663502.1 GNAT family N-acetyltransferase [Clostridioides sp. ZZV15-6597]
MSDSEYPQMKTLETRNCILRPASLNDTEDFFDCYKNKVVVKHLPFSEHKSLEDTRKFIKSFFLNPYKKGKIGHFAIVYKRDNKVIGNMGFNNINPKALEAEIGICINPNYWGHDFATEITKRVIQYGFRELNLNKIIAITYEENTNSTKSLDLLGFKCVGKYIKKIHTGSTIKNVPCYQYELKKIMSI